MIAPVYPTGPGSVDRCTHISQIGDRPERCTHIGQIADRGSKIGQVGVPMSARLEFGQIDVPILDQIGRCRISVPIVDQNDLTLSGEQSPNSRRTSPNIAEHLPNSRRTPPNISEHLADSRQPLTPPFPSVRAAAIGKCFTTQRSEWCSWQQIQPA
jgi:hypothetical protein